MCIFLRLTHTHLFRAQAQPSACSHRLIAPGQVQGDWNSQWRAQNSWHPGVCGWRKTHHFHSCSHSCISARRVPMGAESWDDLKTWSSPMQRADHSCLPCRSRARSLLPPPPQHLQNLEGFRAGGGVLNPPMAHSLTSSCGGAPAPPPRCSRTGARVDLEKAPA